MLRPSRWRLPRPWPVAPDEPWRHGAARDRPLRHGDHSATYKHIIWVMMENHSYNTIIGSSQAPYINSLASECGLATNYHNISHPSLPNYMAATAGLSTR